MSQELVPYAPPGGELLRRREARGIAQRMSRMNAGANVRVAGIESEADVQSAKVEAVGYVAKRAMFVVGSVTQAEQQLAQMFPLAATRLQAIGDMAAFAAAEVVADTQSRLRRA